MSSATKLANQSELADALRISDRRVRQLEDRGVVVRHSDGNYDVDRNRRRYRLFIDRNIDEVTAGVEKAAKGADDALDELRAEPNLEQRRLLSKRLGPAIGELDCAMRLANALAGESARPMLESYTRMVVGRAASEFLELCNLQIAAE
jgi:hypothetical protein